MKEGSQRRDSYCHSNGHWGKIRTTIRKSAPFSQARSKPFTTDRKMLHLPVIGSLERFASLLILYSYLLPKNFYLLFLYYERSQEVCWWIAVPCAPGSGHIISFANSL